MWRIKFVIILCCSCSFGFSQAINNILPEKERAKIVDEILEERLDSLLPILMKREDFDMWVVISREYNEDPVLKTMLPSTWLSARRRTILVFYQKPESEFEKIAIARYDVGKLLKGAWDLDVYSDQWEALNQIIKDRDPKKIGLNISGDFGLADGLVYTEYTDFLAKLPENYHERITSAEPLAIAWLETRSNRELEIFPEICAIGHEILNEAFSSKVITPGVTATEDVIWWLRDRVRSFGP